MMTIYELSGINLITISILCFFAGFHIIERVKILKNYHIPESVVGGLMFSFAACFIAKAFNIKIIINTELRDIFLLIFFCTIGMLAKFHIIIDGGRRLLKMMLLMFSFIAIQNTVGVIVALATGANPLNGLIAGSVSLIGGHGTAIPWGMHFESIGYHGAVELGLIAATVGLLLGGMIGGGVAGSLIKQYKLQGSIKNDNTASYEHSLYTTHLPACAYTLLQCMLSISCCILIGSYVYEQISATGLVIPKYLPVLFLGAIFINLTQNNFYQSKLKISSRLINLLNDISLQVFVTMSMMSIEIDYLIDFRTINLMIIIAIQVCVIIAFSRFIFFKVAGKDYDAAVITSGFIGSGLGATPVGLANAATICKRFGPSPKALFLIPFIGSVFTDVINASMLQLFLMLPIFK